MGGSGGPVGIVTPVFNLGNDLAKGVLSTAKELATGSEAKKARGAAQDAMNRQENEARRMNEEAQARVTAQESQAAASAAQEQARNRQRQLAAGAQGRNSTILTSPLGVPDDGSQPDLKNLLGV